MDQNDKDDKIAELNEQETEQVVGGASANTAGIPANRANHGSANLGGGLGSMDALRNGSTVSPRPLAE